MSGWIRRQAAPSKIVDIGGVAPNANPEDAYQSLLLRLRYLKRLTNDETANFAADLKNYRNIALGTQYEERESFQSPYFDRLFPYIHNEFLFNSARKVGPLAQISHLAFAPVYVDKFTADNGVRKLFPDDPMKLLDLGTFETLQWLWRRAINDFGPKNDFRGGKDDILKYLRDLPDFSEPYSTPKRYIFELKKSALAISSTEARLETEEYDRYFLRSGFSNILANTVEFFWRASNSRKGHFRWARHDRPYQTFTFTNEYARTLDGNSASAVQLGSEEWTKAILGAVTGASRDEKLCMPFDQNALQDLKVDTFAKIMGRYVHGANFLILPLKLFLNCTLATRYSPGAPAASLLSRLLDAAPPGLVSEEKAQEWRRWAEAPDTAGLWDKNFRALMRSFQENNESAGKLDSLVIGATRDFLLNHCLLVDPQDRFDAEFVGYKCMSGRAYVFTDVRNRPHRKQAEQDGLFSRTVIIDCGLNNYERGRLIQTITEFATERVMSLQWLPRFRLVHHALNVVQTRVSLALAHYQSGARQPEETLPSFYVTRVQRSGDDSGPEGLLNSLEFLSSCLSVLNDVVEGGIMDRSNASVPAHGAILKKLGSIGEERLPGYQSLSDYLERRYARPLRTIVRVGERYEMLRRRITEIAELVNVRMQASQNDSQEAGITRGLIITALAIMLALVALAHPLGEVILGLEKSGEHAGFVDAIRACAAIAIVIVGAYLIFRPAKRDKRFWKRWGKRRTRGNRGPLRFLKY